jgi:sporulation protein YlmC with PRC-barrel domain
MAHCGCLKSESVPNDVHDIRGTTVRGSDGEKLGNINDVVFDHDTMEIRYLAIHSGGRLDPGTFLLPANRVSVDRNHADDLSTEVTREQIENSPRYDQKSLASEKDWKKDEQEFKKYWEENPVMHIKGSDRIITPPEEPVSVQASSNEQGSSRPANSEVNPAELFPERISEVFSDPAPKSGKVTLRPKSVARAEEGASGVTLLKPRWWESFENYLRINKSDIQAKCSQCSSAAA